MKTFKTQTVDPKRDPIEILVVQDNPTDFLRIQKALENGSDLNVRVIQALRLSDGMRHLSRRGFDLALLDLDFAGNQGMEVFDRLRKEIPELPLVVLTDLDDDRVATQIVRRGAQDCLIKTNGYVHLLGRSIRYALERHRVITEHEDQVRRLVESEARIRTIIEASADAALIVDKNGLVQFVNPMAAQMFGRPADALLNQPFGHPMVKNKPAELDIIRGDGTIGIAEMRAVETVWGEQPVFLASLRDITAHKQVEEIEKLNVDLERRVAERTAELRVAKEEAESHNRLKSAFLATMSHELRTPLNSIIGFSEFLIDGKAGPLAVKQHDYLTDILNSGRHLLQLINNVLDLSKIEAGKLEFFPEHFLVSRALQEVCSVLSPMALRKKVEITLRVDPAVDDVRLDLPKFKQVLYNLISNAVKFNRERGRVNVSVNGSPERFCLHVSDSGIGIKPEDISKLFVEFHQLDSGLSRCYEGTGLGLALTHRIVGLQNGEIKVSSEVGKGTTFLVEMPRFLEVRSQ
jgi:signal transduction histidine kinase